MGWTVAMPTDTEGWLLGLILGSLVVAMILTWQIAQAVTTSVFAFTP